VIAADPGDSRLYARITWRIIPFFCLCFLAAYIDRTNIGFAKLQMAKQLGFSEAVYGLGAGLFFAGYILCEVPSNLILAKVGARLWIMRIMVSWGLVSAVMMFVETPWQFYALRFLLGVAEAGFLPGVFYYLNQWYPPDRRSRIIGLFLTGIPLSNVIGAPVSGWILSALSGASGLAGWQWLFLIEAVPTVLLGFGTLAVLADRIETASWLSASEKSRLAANLDLSGQGHQLHSFLDAAKDWRVWMIGFVDWTVLLGLYAINFWLPTLIRNTGEQNMTRIGWLTAIPHLVALIAIVANGYHSDRTRERRWHVVVPLLAGAAGLASSAYFAGDLTMTIVCLSLANAGIIAFLAPFWCIPGTFLQGRAAAGGIALALSIANTAGLIANPLIGWLIDLTHTANAALVLFAGALVVSAGVVLRLPAKLVNR
jgi:MFS family permease